MIMNQQTANFKFHFDRLQNTASRLSSNQVDIDELESLIEASVESKKFCEKRIEAVKASVQRLLQNDSE
jgi:exodeoxyribonuclease VII small subunit